MHYAEVEYDTDLLGVISYFFYMKYDVIHSLSNINYFSLTPH